LVRRGSERASRPEAREAREARGKRQERQERQEAREAMAHSIGGGGQAGGAPHLKAQAEGRRLFIGGLNYETTDQSLQGYLATRYIIIIIIITVTPPPQMANRGGASQEVP
jgi:RNA recognition motif-containing protein